MLKKVLVATALVTLSGAALAHPPHWAPANGYRAHYAQPYEHYYYPPAPRVVYRPVPVYPAATVVIPAPGFSIRLRLPL
jgi:hypothetical protein